MSSKMRYPYGMAHWMVRKDPTPRVDKMIPKMPYVIPKDPIRIKGGTQFQRWSGFSHQLRLVGISNSLTDLVRDERIELTYFRAYEVRNYAERLIMEAIRYGDCHNPTMDLANFYLKEKQLIHKLFKVLVPRYLNYSQSFTAMHLLPIDVNANRNLKKGEKIRLGQCAILELKGNPYPSVRNEPIDSRNFLTNVLLKAAKREYYKEKDKQNDN